MRICFVSQEYPPETARGGLGTQTYAKAHGLSRLGHEVVVVSAAKGGVCTELSDGNITVIRIPGFHPRMPVYTDAAAWITYSSEVAAEVARLHGGEPLDLIDFAEWGGEGFVHLLNRSEWNYIPTTVQLHGPIVMFAKVVGWPAPGSELYRIGRLMEETSVRLADAVYSSSHYTKQWCVTEYGLDGSRIPVLHTGVDTERFRPGLAPKEERPTILFVGRVDRQKGVDVLLDAACILAAEVPGLRLRLIGDGNTALAAQLTCLARNRGFDDLVEVRGYVTHDKLPVELNRGHVLAVPSSGEGGPGFAYLEAMASGLPVIACREGGAAELITDRETGWLVGDRNVPELVEALRWFLTNPQACRRMGLQARKRVLDSADSAKCIAALEAFYTAVVYSVRKKCQRSTLS